MKLLPATHEALNNNAGLRLKVRPFAAQFLGRAGIMPVIEVSGGVPGKDCVFPDDCPIDNGGCYNWYVNQGPVCPNK